MTIDVYAIPENGGDPFLMFIAEMGTQHAHENVAKTRHLYTQKIGAYQFRHRVNGTTETWKVQPVRISVETPEM